MIASRHASVMIARRHASVTIARRHASVTIASEVFSPTVWTASCLLFDAPPYWAMWHLRMSLTYDYVHAKLLCARRPLTLPW